jgi:hypothetical protein
VFEEGGLLFCHRDWKMGDRNAPFLPQRELEITRSQSIEDLHFKEVGKEFIIAGSLK